MNRIRALAFDLWGTLMRDLPERLEARNALRLRLLREALSAVGHSRSDEEIGAALRAFGEEHVALHAQERDIPAQERTQLFLAKLDPSLAGRLSPEDERRVEEAMTSPARHLPPVAVEGAPEVLAEAKRRGLGVGLVSNTGWTPGYVLRGSLAELGLLPYLDVLTFSDEVGEAKPAPGIFRRTLQALGVEPGEAAFLGDVPGLDVVGPLRVGMWSVQIGDARLDGAEPHARITALSELFPTLDSLGLLPRRGSSERRRADRR